MAITSDCSSREITDQLGVRIRRAALLAQCGSPSQALGLGDGPVLEEWPRRPKGYTASLIYHAPLAVVGIAADLHGAADLRPIR